MTQKLKERLLALEIPRMNRSMRSTMLRLQHGATLEKIARNRGLALSTVQNHVEKLIMLGLVTVDAHVASAKVRVIRREVERLETALSAEVMPELGNAVSWFECKAVINGMVAEARRGQHGEVVDSLPEEDSRGAVLGDLIGAGQKKVRGSWSSIEDGERGHSYASLFGDAIRGSRQIVLNDPYLATTRHQKRNLMEFCKAVKSLDGSTTKVRVVTKVTADTEIELQGTLSRIRDEVVAWGIEFEFEFSPHIHDRHIRAGNHVVMLGRGLDIFKPFSAVLDDGVTNPLTIDQALRECREFQVAVLEFVSS